MKKAGKTLLVIACVIGITVGGICLMIDRQVAKMVEQLDAIAVVVPEQVADGTYEGSAETPLVKVTVEVNVQDYTLKDVRLLLHENGQGTPAETMFPEMLSRNTSEVDNVSGVTLSSKAISSAVRDALAKGPGIEQLPHRENGIQAAKDSMTGFGTV